MALKSLTTEMIGEEKVLHHYKGRDTILRVYAKEFDKHNIVVDHEFSNIFFKIQNGPVKEVGKNGCQVDHMIMASREILINLNKELPCEENIQAIDKLTSALIWLRERRNNREARGVEGYNKV